MAAGVVSYTHNGDGTPQNHLASSSTVLRHVFLGLPRPRLPWEFHSRAYLAISLDRFHIVWTSHPPLAFPDLQIHSRLLRALPQLFIRYLVRPENSQYFPEALISKYLQFGCYTFLYSQYSHQH